MTQSNWSLRMPTSERQAFQRPWTAQLTAPRKASGPLYVPLWERVVGWLKKAMR